MQSQATLKFTQVTPRKARQVVNLIRDKRVEEALNILAFTKKHAAEVISKVIKSAIANANQFKRVDIENLRFEKIEVDPGPMLRNAKRFIPRAMGRASLIHHRTSHIRVVVSDEKAGKKTSVKGNQKEVALGTKS
jgi:large subunit ribosomal protein L22